jgi:pyrroloquinoline quinone biosynthesis protein E
VSAPRLWNLIAELTYRCPLRCPYCSNPTDASAHRDALDAPAWGRAFAEARALGAVHVGLTGGEPTLRRDLVEIVRAAAAAELHVHLVTAGVPLEPEGLGALARAGLASVQLSVQDAEAAASDRIAGSAVFERKLAFGRAARALGLPLTLNVVLHRHNLPRVPALVALARRLGARRLELANAQYHGFALRNRAALLPTREQLAEAARAAEVERARTPGLEIVFVLPDYFAERPKPCMGGWGSRSAVVAPDGHVLPCHGAAELPLEFWSLTDRSLRECWESAPGMNAYRGEAWMREPCRSCPERARDFGGCRCQAFALLGDAAATDPACALSPEHAALVRARESEASASREVGASARDEGTGFAWRSYR